MAYLQGRDHLWNENKKGRVPLFEEIACREKALDSCSDAETYRWPVEFKKFGILAIQTWRLIQAEREESILNLILGERTAQYIPITCTESGQIKLAKNQVS